MTTLQKDALLAKRGEDLYATTSAPSRASATIPSTRGQTWSRRRGTCVAGTRSVDRCSSDS